MAVAAEDILDLIDDAVLTWNQNGVILYCNKNAEALFSCRAADAVSALQRTLMGTEGKLETDKLLLILKNQHAWSGEIELTDSAGKNHTLQSGMQANLDSDGQMTVVEIDRDITGLKKHERSRGDLGGEAANGTMSLERRKMADALRENETRLRLATEKTGVAVYTYDFALDKTFWSDQYKVLLGLPSDSPELTKELVQNAMHPDDLERLKTAVSLSNNPVFRNALEMDYRIIRPDRSVRWLHVKGQTMFSGDGLDAVPLMAAGTIVDITEKKLADDKIRRISEELTKIIESTDDIIFSVGIEHVIIFCNTAAKKHFHQYYGVELYEGGIVTEILSEEDAQDLGDLIHTAIRVGKLQVDLRTKRGGRVISYSVNPVFINGGLVEVTVFGKDITERLHSEREIINLNATLEKIVAERTQQLKQTETNFKNITLALSRDLKSTVQSIGQYVDEIVDRKDTLNNAERIKKHCRGMMFMINGLIQYEKSLRTEIVKEEVNIRKLVVSVWNELNDSARLSGTLEFETGLPPVMADRDELRHVLFQIVSNTLKFATPGAAPKLVVGCRADKKSYVYYFRDYGIGFDKSYSKKAFEVFERQYPDVYEGSGVGLAIVKNIVSRHEGKVWIESEEGTGTTVFIALPMS